ncbi:MAG: hypothetical protein ACRDWV_04110 [Acidimicrobiales bacterium]
MAIAADDGWVRAASATGGADWVVAGVVFAGVVFAGVVAGVVAGVLVAGVLCWERVRTDEGLDLVVSLGAEVDGAVVRPA